MRRRGLVAMLVLAGGAMPGLALAQGASPPPLQVGTRPITSPPPLPIPPLPADGKPHSATPMGNPGGWVTNNDYPSRALREQREGATGFQLSITPEGRVSGCVITSSSGSPDLDATTCSLMMRRGRFRPASDADGKPVAGTYTSRIRWIIPAAVELPRVELAQHPVPGQSVITYTIGVDGRASDCQLVSGPDPARFMPFSMPCASNQVFPVYLDAKGQPVPRKVRLVLTVSLPAATPPATRKKRR